MSYSASHSHFNQNILFEYFMMIILLKLSDINLIIMFSLQWNEDKVEEGSFVTVDNPRTVNFTPTSAYIIRQVIA